MRLIKLQLDSLYHVFDYTVEFNFEDRITILTAPNGYGKTTVLKIIYSLFTKNFGFFNHLIFKKIIFYFDENITIELEKNDSEEDEFNQIKFTLKRDAEIPINFDYPSKKIISRLKRKIPSRILEDIIPDLVRIEKDKWFHETIGEMSFEDVVYQYAKHLPNELVSKFDIELPDELLKFFDSIDVYFIQEQRLILKESTRHHNRLRQDIQITNTIEKYAKELSEVIKTTIGEYAQVSQSLDSSFPKRVFQKKTETFDNSILNKRLSKLQEKRKKISNYGLLKSEEDAIETADTDIGSNNIGMLSVYIADNEKKLSVFDSLINRLELFVDILNTRRFYLKKIEINEERGFLFKTDNNVELKLTELSSGEQHEVVLLYELLFKAEENSLVLIDEPEISLHVAWQVEFLGDMKDIINLREFDVIISTHSPQIIDDRWDLTVELKDLKR